MKQFGYLIGLLFLISCGNSVKKTNDHHVRYEIFDPVLNELLDTNTTVVVIGRGYDWSEGPLWIPGQKMLLFSDVPQNKIYAWREGEKNAALWLDKAGYTGNGTGDGPNGLLLSKLGNLIICQHGDRRIAEMTAPVDKPAPEFRTITGEWEGKIFNSPNDACLINDTLYFTDPPYGLRDTSSREIPFNGVYMYASGKTIVVVDSMDRPNGIAVTPDGKYLYIANSSPEKAIWVKYLRTGDSLQFIKTIDKALEAAKTEPRLPDGLKIHPTGTMFATGPGGIWIFNKNDDLIGKIKFDQPASNCAFDDTFTSLFVTADSLVYKISLRQ